MIFNRSPHDFEGTIVVSGIFVIAIIAAPAFVAGLLIVALSRQKS